MAQGAIGNIEQVKLFYAWLDCSMLLKLSAVDSCALGVLLMFVLVLLLISSGLRHGGLAKSELGSCFVATYYSYFNKSVFHQIL